MRAEAVLEEMRRMLDASLPGPAARSAYIAAMHAAQALIFEQEGRVARTHSGVHAEFARITRLDATLPAHLRGFLGRAYGFKTASDYALGAEALVGSSDAEEAALLAREFVSWIGRRLGAA